LSKRFRITAARAVRLKLDFEAKTPWKIKETCPEEVKYIIKGAKPGSEDDEEDDEEDE